MLGASKLLAMAKDFRSFHLTIVGEVFFRLISCYIIFQLLRPFQEHLSPHQFEVSTPRGCETITFNIKAFFDLHPNWIMTQFDVKNIFNNISQTVIFRKLQDAKGSLVSIIPFTKLFHGVHSFF
jgi:hypothetical protein